MVERRSLSGCCGVCGAGVRATTRATENAVACPKCGSWVIVKLEPKPAPQAAAQNSAAVPAGVPHPALMPLPNIDHVPCDTSNCRNVSDSHTIEVDGWRLVPNNRCSECAASRAKLGGGFLAAQVFCAGLVLLIGPLVMAHHDLLLGVAILVAAVVVLPPVAWHVYPELGVFAWVRRRAARRLVTEGNWYEIARAAPALVLPNAPAVRGELVARFRHELRDGAAVDILHLAALLDRCAAGWQRAENQAILAQLVGEWTRPGDRYRALLTLILRPGPHGPAREDLTKQFLPAIYSPLPEDRYCELVALLDQADPYWPAREAGLPVRLLPALCSTIAEVGRAEKRLYAMLTVLGRAAPDWLAVGGIAERLSRDLTTTLRVFQTGRACPEPFTAEDGGGYLEGSTFGAKATPELTEGESLNHFAILTRLNLLERVLNHPTCVVPQVVANELLAWTNLGITGCLGTYRYEPPPDDRGNRLPPTFESQTGIKVVVSCQDVREAARCKLTARQ